MIVKEIDNGFMIIHGDDFNAEHILECGQVFRYEKTLCGYKVYAGKHQAMLLCQEGTTTIICDNKKFFANYFDFGVDYDTIKLKLSKDNLLKCAIEYGRGIRILNQDPYEVIISFIISANNNIPRIRKIIDGVCKRFGTQMDGYYAFPTIDQLINATSADFHELGCGYRDKYLVDTVARLKDMNLEELQSLPTQALRKVLLTLKGVGRKVADCILLFGFHRMDVFPVDTWIQHLYYENYHGEQCPPDKISDYFVQTYGKLAGYAQQYLYYAKMKNAI